MYIYSNRRSRSCSSSYREKLSSVRIVSTSVCTQPHCSRRGTRYVVRASTMGHGGGAPCRASLCVKGRRRRGPEKASKSTYPRVLTDFTKYAFQPLVTSDRDRYCKISLSPFLVFFFFFHPSAGVSSSSSFSSSPLVAIASWKVSEAKGGASRKRFQKSFPFSKRGEKIASIERERREQKTCPRAVCLG